MMSRSAQKRERGVGPAGSEDVGQAGRRSGQGLCEGAGAVGVGGRGEFAFRPLLLSYHGLDRQVGDLWDCVMRTGVELSEQDRGDAGPLLARPAAASG
jgi:hypothetical protein